MNKLFLDLIHNLKVKRWFTILGNLEEQPVMTSAELASLTDCTMRTIQSDTKEIKRYFEQTIRLLGDDEGQHLNLVEPILYMRKKQELLQKEVLFIFLDALLKGKKKKNKEWAIDLSVSPTLFGRMKRGLVQTLEENYRIRLNSEDNRLEGEEAAIRQLMSDFYYTLPLYPKNIEKRANHLDHNDWCLKKQEWVIDTLILRQWGWIFLKRLEGGNQLPDKKEFTDTKIKLADAFDQTFTTTFTLPTQEKAALFLLSLKEEQFIHSKMQQKFVKQFSSDLSQDYNEENFEDFTYQFFDTMIFLMKNFYQLPVLPLEPNKSSKEVLLENMMSRYSQIKTQLKQSILVTYELSGPRVLQEWIKETIRVCLEEVGYYSIEKLDPSQIPFITSLKVTNFHPEGLINSETLALSQIPNKQEITDKVRKMTFEIRKKRRRNDDCIFNTPRI